jgi:hypothetical protein
MRDVKYTRRFRRDYRREKSGMRSKQLDALLMEAIFWLPMRRCRAGISITRFPANGAIAAIVTSGPIWFLSTASRMLTASNSCGLAHTANLACRQVKRVPRIQLTPHRGPKSSMAQRACGDAGNGGVAGHDERLVRTDGSAGASPRQRPEVPRLCAGCPENRVREPGGRLRVPRDHTVIVDPERRAGPPGHQRWHGHDGVGARH